MQEIMVKSQAPNILLDIVYSGTTYRLYLLIRTEHTEHACRVKQLAVFGFVEMLLPNLRPSAHELTFCGQAGRADVRAEAACLIALLVENPGQCFRC